MKMTKKLVSLMLSVLMIVAVLSLSGIVTQASALEKIDVLLWAPGGDSYEDEELEDIKNAINTLNYKVSDYSLTKTKQMYDFSELGFIMVFTPRGSISDSDINILKEFNEAGGHIMFVGESAGYSSQEGNINGKITSAANKLGFNIAFSATSSTTPRLSVAVPINSPSPLFMNVTELTFIYAGEIIQTDNATEQLLCENKVCFAGKYVGNGYMSVVTDSNVFGYSETRYYHSSKENVTTFLMNCYNMSKITQLEEYAITVSLSGGDYATTVNTVRRGDNVALTAPSFADWEFIGWYENGELISTETELAFVAASDRNLEVKFEHIHSYETEIIAPTCTEDGYTKHTCPGCSHSYNDTTVEATGHNPGGWFTAVKETVYKEGTKQKKCTVCYEIVESAAIPQLKCAKPVLRKVYNANSYVKVLWSAVKGADVYRVYRKIGSGEYKYIGSTTNKYFNDKNAAAGKICRYLVKAGNEAGFSEASVSKLVRHIDEPTLKSAENTANGILIKWGKVTGADRYSVYRKVSGGEYKYIGATSKAYYTDTTAKSGTYYHYAIRAKNNDSISSLSDSRSKLYLADPTLKSISNTEHGVLVKWGKVSGADKYNVYRKTGSGSYSKIATTKNIYYTDKNAKSGVKYYYIVKAVKSTTTSVSSNVKSIYHLADPTLKTPASAKSGIKLSWSKVTGAEGYIIYRKTGSGSYSKLKTEKGVSNLSYTDSSAKKGKKYTYKIKAYKSSTYSAYSNAKAVTDKY